MCTKITEAYSCTHQTPLPPTEDIACAAKFQSGLCTLTEAEKPFKIIERSWVCRRCWSEDKEWVQVGKGGVDGPEENVDVEAAAWARKRHARKGECVVM